LQKPYATTNVHLFGNIRYNIEVWNGTEQIQKPDANSKVHFIGQATTMNISQKSDTNTYSMLLLNYWASSYNEQKSEELSNLLSP
jgi:hypothetical protein